MNLAAHPRLYISAEHYRRVQQPSHLPILNAAARRVTELAERFAADPTIVVDETGHNYHLIRARRMQTRVVTLLAEFRRTGDRRFRDTILAGRRGASPAPSAPAVPGEGVVEAGLAPGRAGVGILG